MNESDFIFLSFFLSYFCIVYYLSRVLQNSDSSVCICISFIYRDNKGQTPYVVAPEKEIRDVFTRYMGDNPDKYDYSKAQVPGALSAKIKSKQMERKKAQGEAKKQREKEEKRKQEFEAEEKRRFASLTDREKVW